LEESESFSVFIPKDSAISLCLRVPSKDHRVPVERYRTHRAGHEEGDVKRATWILQGLLALVFLMAGGTKLTSTRAELVANGMGWAQDYSDTGVMLIGAAEVAGAIGLIAPAATGIVPVLTPAAGVGLALLMLGAVVTHLQRGEGFVPALLLAVLAALSAVLRLKVQR
jgi:hypothetical protein